MVSECKYGFKNIINNYKKNLKLNLWTIKGNSPVFLFCYILRVE